MDDKLLDRLAQAIYEYVWFQASQFPPELLQRIKEHHYPLHSVFTAFSERRLLELSFAPENYNVFFFMIIFKEKTIRVWGAKVITQDKVLAEFQTLDFCAPYYFQELSKGELWLRRKKGALENTCLEQLKAAVKGQYHLYRNAIEYERNAKIIDYTKQ